MRLIAIINVKQLNTMKSFATTATMLCILAMALLAACPAAGAQNSTRLVGMGEGHDSITFEQITNLGLLVVDVETIDHEWPTCDYVTAPLNAWGRSITNVTKVPGRLRVWKAGQVAFDSGDFLEDVRGMTIRIRGNTSAYYPKKPYKIELQDKGDLLLRNTPSLRDKDWLLVRDEYFKTLQGLELNRFLGMQWTPAYRYVNLVVNNEFLGIYMLVESIKRNTNCRLKVSKNGFIFERDAYWWNDKFYIPSTLGNALHYTFKYPNEKDLTDSDIDYITGVLAGFERSVGDGTYPEHIDVESFATWCLGHDILSTFDAAGTNRYYTKYDRTPQSLITMPLMWDFDSTEADSLKWSRCHNIKFSKLFRNSNKAFVKAYVNKWMNVREQLVPSMQSTLSRYKMSADGQALPNSMRLNNTRWGESYLSFGSIDARAQWFTHRYAWLDSAIMAMLPHGDVNGDFSVDINDVNEIVNMILELKPTEVGRADLTGDGNVDIVDVSLLIDIILKSSPVEPASLILSANEVAIDPNGGSAFVDITTSADWYIEPDDIPEWLHVDPKGGEEGWSTIIFSADTTDVSRSARLRIYCEELVDTITVVQQIAAIDTVACIADFINGVAGNADSCAITGVVTNIEASSQGRIALRDWSGTTYANGVEIQPEFASLKCGYIVTVSGKRAVYDDLPQLVDAIFNLVVPVEPVDIAVADTLPDSASDHFMFTGTIASVIDAQTGALILADGNGHSLRVESIGMGWGATGDARIGMLEAFGLAVGDTITIIGCKSSDNGEPLIINAFYFSHNKQTD